MGLRSPKGKKQKYKEDQCKLLLKKSYNEELRSS